METFLRKVKKNIRVIDNRPDIEDIQKSLEGDVLRLIPPCQISLPQVFEEDDRNNASLIYAMLATFLGRKTYEIGPDEEIVATMKTFSGL